MERIPGFLTSLLSSKSTKYTVALLAAFFLLKKVRKRQAMKRIQSSAAARVAVVVKERNDAVQWAKKESELIDEGQRKKIEAMTFKQVQEALQSGVVSAEAVMRVYFGLAAKAHEATNCLTGLIKEALTQAQKMDEEAKKPGYKKSPLWGIPLSVKDSVMVKGHRYTWGLVSSIDFIPAEDSFAIMKLRAEGMIPFVQTNVPTAGFWYNCDNSVFGTTSNPHAPARTSGGSSGGEGALIGSLGSIVGLGADIGGSIRIPAAYSGCCGFKPSATRFSTLQMAEPAPFRPILMPTEGPLAQDPHAIVAIMRSIWSDHFISNQDPLSVPVDFREDLFKEGSVYRIGYYTSDGYIDPLPGNQRVVREAVELLKAKGHTLVPFSLGDIASEMSRVVCDKVYADGGARMRMVLQGEPLSPLTDPLRAMMNTPPWTKTVLGWFAGGDAAADVQAAIDRLYATRKRLVQKMKDEKIDLILCPSTLSPALPHALPYEIPATVITSTFLWNAMDFPAGVVTTGKWTENDEKELGTYAEKGAVESGLKRGCKNSIGLPLSVQIVAPPFRDESVLRAMVDLFDAVKNGGESQKKE